MKNSEKVIPLIKTYKELITTNKNLTLDDYDLGLVNGLEIALSLIEDRPVFYIKPDKTYYKYDMEKYPDYFI